MKALALPNAISINLLNWKLEKTYTSASEYQIPEFSFLLTIISSLEQEELHCGFPDQKDKRSSYLVLTKNGFSDTFCS